MLGDVDTSDSVIAVSFPQDASAYEALARLKQLDSDGEVGVRTAVVVVREQDGKIVEKDEFGHDSYSGTAGGGLIGLLIGVLGGPVGVLVGGATGVLVGSLFDEDDVDETESVLGEISKSIRVGHPGLLADVSEDGPTAIDAVMANLDGTVLRRSALDVEAELAAAKDAQRAAKRKARQELREAREKKQKEEIDTKIAELKAKLHGHQQAAPSGESSVS
jgi:uncharacterized membrane protein